MIREARQIGGIGVHTGQNVTVCLAPGQEGSGWRFVRVDLPGAPEIAAHPSKIVAAVLSTTLGEGEASVQTAEHLLAALWATGHDDLRIEVDGPEVPILDGSALPWLALLGERPPQDGELQVQGDPRGASARPPRVGKPLQEPLVLVEGDAFLTAFPCDELRFSYGIELPAPVGVQWASFAPERDDFSREIAPARTFIRQADAERLRAAGGLAGGDLRCALVLGPQGWLNPPLRFENEPARHKLLDLLGDLALLGEIPRAHYVAYRAGHRLHGALARRLAS